MVARSDAGEPGAIAQQAAASLAALVEEPAALLMASRRLLDRHPTCGPLWWLVARVLASPDPASEVMQAADDLDDDPTPSALARRLAPDPVVAVLGWPEQVADALHRRLDVATRIVDAGGDGALLASRLERAGGDATLIPDTGLAAAVAASDLVLLEATALGPDGLCAVSGSRAAAAVAHDAGRPVWVVAGTGRVLPKLLWDALVDRSSHGAPWQRPDEFVPLRLVDQVVGPGGPEPVDVALERADSPHVPELARTGLTPGSERSG
jgi:hypothetical protein